MKAVLAPVAGAPGNFLCPARLDFHSRIAGGDSLEICDSLNRSYFS